MQPEFCNHNILLDDGTRTIPGVEFLISNWEFCKGVIRTLDHVFKGRDRSAIRVADLGCLEGGYSVAFARHGYQVLGIEAREKNYKKCLYVKSRVDLPNLEFVKDDVRNIEKYGTFDAVFCSGVLYHLDKPYSFLKTLGQVTRDVLLVQSHYATGALKFLFPPCQQPPSLLEWNIRLKWMKFISDLKRKFPYLLNGGKPYQCLSRLSVHEGKLGRWAFEYSPQTSREKVEDLSLSAYGNPVSFWLHKKDLLQSIKESGFGIIYEQYDNLGNISANRYIENHNRSLFVGIKNVPASSLLTDQQRGVSLRSNQNSASNKSEEILT